MTKQTEKQQRVDEICEMLETGMPEKYIVKHIMYQYGIRSRQTVYNYIHEANAIITTSDDGPADSGEPMSAEQELAVIANKRQTALVMGDIKHALQLEQLAASIAKRTGALAAYAASITSDQITTQTMKLSHRQSELLAHFKPGQRYGIPTAWNRTAQSLQRRGLLHLTDCGMATSAGKTVYIGRLAD